jgi:hypothetical protein
VGKSSEQYLNYQEEQHYLGYNENYCCDHAQTAPYTEQYKPEPLLSRIKNSIHSAIKAIRSKLAPKPTANLYELHREQARIESSASFIQNQIKKCDSLKYLESLSRMTDNLLVIYGNKTQVTSWIDSLKMQLYLKQQQLTNQ